MAETRKPRLHRAGARQSSISSCTLLLDGELDYPLNPCQIISGGSCQHGGPLNCLPQAAQH